VSTICLSTVFDMLSLGVVVQYRSLMCFLRYHARARHIEVLVCMCACVSVCLCVSLGINGGGRVCMFYHCCFLASVRHFVLLLKYERCHLNKI